MLTQFVPIVDKVHEHYQYYLDLLQQYIIEEIDDASILPEAINLAFIKAVPNGHISSFDAIYHALAIKMKGTFLTLDKRHYNKTHQYLGHIMLLDDLAADY